LAYPDPHGYLTHFPVFVQAFGGRAFEERTAWQLGDFAAVSLWLPPGVQADGDAVVEVLAETVAPSLHDDLFAVLGQMAKTHPTHRIGIYRGSASTPSTKAPALEASSSRVA
jgi:hypothetical protein